MEVWLVRIADPSAGGGYDDTLKADSAEVFTFPQAEAKARD
jgi:hypothetical protein